MCVHVGKGCPGVVLKSIKFIAKINVKLPETRCIINKINKIGCKKYHKDTGSWTAPEGDQFKVNMSEKKLISKTDIEMYLTWLNNI